MALFILTHMFSTLDNYWRQAVKPRMNSPEIWFRLGSSPRRWESAYKFDLASLGYLASDSKSYDVLTHVALQERRFQEALSIMESRTEVLVRDARLKMDVRGLTDETANEESVRAALGPITAASLMKDWLDVDVAVTQLRAKYLPIVSKAIGGKKGATWAQLDRRIQMMVDLQLSSKTPLVQAQSK